MKNRIIWTVLLVLSSISILTAEEPSFSGTWKLNMKKGQLNGQTYTLENMASGLLHIDFGGFAYDFDLKGNQYPTPDGGTTSCLETTPTTREGTNRMNGKVVSTYSLSLNGDSISWAGRLIKADGSIVEQSGTSTRVSGGPEFLGKWKQTDVKGTPTSMEIAIKGEKGITIKYPESQSECTGSIDMKDYPLREAERVSKITLAFESTGTNTMKITTKLSGKPFFIDVLTLSPDGQTLTDDGNTVSVDEPVKAVYERQ
jgi:hypothetical protein